MRRLLAVLAVCAVAAVVPAVSLAAPALSNNPCSGITCYVFIDNYGGNSDGYLASNGHDNQAETFADTPYATSWVFVSSSTSGYYLICDKSDNLCLNASPTNSKVYLSSQIQSDHNEQWRLFNFGTNHVTVQNLATDDALTADSLSAGAGVVVGEGPPTGLNQWDIITGTAPTRAVLTAKIVPLNGLSNVDLVWATVLADSHGHATQYSWETSSSTDFTSGQNCYQDPTGGLWCNWKDSGGLCLNPDSSGSVFADSCQGSGDHAEDWKLIPIGGGLNIMENLHSGQYLSDTGTDPDYLATVSQRISAAGLNFPGS